MTGTVTRRIGLAAVGWVAVALSAAEAQQPNVTDIATCNEAAQAKAWSPSASPGPAPTAPLGPSIEPPAQPRSPADAPTLRWRPGTQTDPSGSIVVQSPDPLLEGITTDGLADPPTGPRIESAWRAG
jgi:hypothetical protein